jgi:hypothetical protein
MIKPTREELIELTSEYGVSAQDIGPLVAAALARWGRPAIQPAAESELVGEHFEWELLDEDGRQIAHGHWPDLDSARQEGLDLLNTYLPEDRRRLVIRRHQAFASVVEAHML